ncbi:MAG: CPBP family intramembrane metalloprotease [Saprospiraceae bacterium]|nr:CPBP family intramembrane metalloprotease [Saprospiraceae bacterium]
MYIKAALEGKNGMLRSLMLIALLIVGFIIGQIPLIYFIDTASSAESHNMGEILLLILLLLGYVGGLSVLLLFYGKIHKRSIRTLISGDSSISVARILWAFFFWFGLLLIAEAILYFVDPANYILQFEGITFLILLVVSLILIPIQTSFEELIFRGYFIQQFSLLFNSRIAGIALSAVIFGFMHMANPEVEAFGMSRMLFYYISFGLFAGICTVIDGRLELVLGIHAATNIYGATMVTFESSVLQTPAIFKIMNLDVPAMFLVFAASSIIFFYLAGRKYHWFSKSAFIDRIQ